MYSGKFCNCTNSCKSDEFKNHGKHYAVIIKKIVLIIKKI